MLGKLLKYDLKWIFKELLLLYLLLIGDAIFIVVISRNTSTPFMDTVEGFSQTLLISLMVTTIVVTLKLSWTRMKRNLYGDEAYLTRTLPISIKTIFLAKVLAGAICMLASLLVVVLAIVMTDFSEVVYAINQAFANLFDTTPIVAAICTISFIFAELCFLLFSGFVGITIGYRFRNHRFAWASIFTVLIYAGGALVLAGIEFLAGLFDPDLNALIDLQSTGDVFAGMRSFILMVWAIYIIYDIGCIIAGTLIQERGVDID